MSPSHVPSLLLSITTTRGTSCVFPLEAAVCSIKLKFTMTLNCGVNAQKWLHSLWPAYRQHGLETAANSPCVRRLRQECFYATKRKIRVAVRLSSQEVRLQRALVKVRVLGGQRGRMGIDEAADEPSGED